MVVSMRMFIHALHYLFEFFRHVRFLFHDGVVVVNSLHVVVVVVEGTFIICASSFLFVTGMIDRRCVRDGIVNRVECVHSVDLQFHV